MKTILLCLMSSIAFSQGEGTKSYSQDQIKKVEKILVQNGIDIKKVEIDNIEEEVPDGGERVAQEYGFSLTVLEPLKFRGNTLTKGSNIFYTKDLIDGVNYFKGIFKIDGVDCQGDVFFTKNKLCNCHLGGDYIVNGFKIPINSRVYFDNGKFVGFFATEDFRFGGETMKMKPYIIDEKGRPISKPEKFDIDRFHCNPML